METSAPSLRALALVFLAIGMQSFGGGMSAWMRREIVLRRGWMPEAQFVSGMALCQIAPGANAVNLAVFIGTTLRGGRGALAALGGMLLVPVIVVLLLGWLFLRVRDVPGVESAMSGLGAAAIGLNIATGLRMARHSIRALAPAAITIGTATAVGLAGLPLPAVLAAVLPLSIWLARA
jgi:chromate transporter